MEHSGKKPDHAKEEGLQSVVDFGRKIDPSLVAGKNKKKHPPVLSFSGLTQISPQDAAILTGYRGAVTLEDLEQIDMATAKALVKVGCTIYLRSRAEIRMDEATYRLLRRHKNIRFIDDILGRSDGGGEEGDIPPVTIDEEVSEKKTAPSLRERLKGILG